MARSRGKKRTAAQAAADESSKPEAVAAESSKQEVAVKEPGVRGRDKRAKAPRRGIWRICGYLLFLWGLRLMPLNPPEEKYDTVVDIIYPLEPPFFADDLVEEEVLPEAEKEKFKEFVKERVRERKIELKQVKFINRYYRDAHYLM